MDKKGKGKAPQKGQKQITNVKQINIKDLPNDEADYLSDCESIDFSCYILRENSKWLMDSGCNRQVTMGIPRGNPAGRKGKAKVMLMMMVPMIMNM